MSIDVRAKQYGKVFGDWQFDKLVGSGSGGKTAVFRLKRPHTNWEEVSALKVVSIIEENGQLEQYSTFFKTDYENRKKELCQKAEEEVRIMYKMHGSAYVVNYFDYVFYDWKEEQRFGCDLLIRMEFLKNLRKQIKYGIIYTETEVIQIGKDICKALIGCHKENIIHRDIKPENIFQNSQGDYKLGDFGISRIVSRSHSATTMIGTWAYAAPEQFVQNGADNYDYRVDIYSLGLVLYELCNQNRLPFAKSNCIREEENQLRIRGKALEKPCNASSMLSDVILKACAYKPENRYQSAQEFLDALVIADDNKAKIKQCSKDENNLYVIKREKKSDIYRTVLAQALNLKDKIEQKSERFEKSAEEMYQIGREYFNGYEGERNYEKALKWWKKAAELGHANAQYMLGYCYYYYEYGVEKNCEEAVKWWTKAAELGHDDAQYKLGICYYNGKGVEKNYEEAVKWWIEAARRHADAQCSLGVCYYNGKGVEQNYKEAVKWWIEAARWHADAQCALGICYYNGDGVEKNYEEAVKWWTKAAERRHANAQYKLGICYYNGKGVEKNYEEAVKWWIEAAEKGHDDAQCSLGVCYYNGKGVEQNYKEAVKWWKKAAKQGNGYAKSKLEDCETAWKRIINKITKK